MCYYKSMKLKHTDLLKILEIDRDIREYQDREDELRNRVYSGFEYNSVDIIVPKAQCKWDLVEMEWGFIPQYRWTRRDVEKYRKGYMDEKTVKYRPPITTLHGVGEELLIPGKNVSGRSCKLTMLISGH
jgi:hypothetical protein